MERLAYAKINLFLAVTGKRADGYHEIDSVMQRVSLADTLTIEKTGAGIAFSCDDPSIPADETNLCVKAAKAYFEKTGVSGGISIALKKKIPAGAGLGGGSADAAAVLSALAEFYPCGASLPAIALSVGADVPFCLEGATARCLGLGEEMTPAEFAGKGSVYALIAKGKNSLSTAEVYRAWDAQPDRAPGAEAFLRALASGDLDAVRALLYNSLEKPAEALLPDVQVLRTLMEAYGAPAPRMTGSGAALFSLSADRARSEKIASLLRQDGFFAEVAELL